MPIYNYKCNNCGYIEEQSHGITEELEYDCPSCGTSMDRVKVNNVYTILRGNGFYSKGG